MFNYVPNKENYSSFSDSNYLVEADTQYQSLDD